MTRKKTLVMLVDAQTFNLDMFHEKIASFRKVINDLGRLIAIKIFFEGNIEEEKIKKVIMNGCVPIIVPSDVDIHMALEAAEYSFNKKIASIIFGTSNINMIPVLVSVKENGKKVILLKDDTENNTLENLADLTIDLRSI